MCKFLLNNFKSFVFWSYVENVHGVFTGQDVLPKEY